MEKVLRSFIHEHFSFDIRVQIELIGKRRDISNEEKQSAIIQLLQDNCIENFAKLGPGTNRYALRLDGLVVKLATDKDGKVDNIMEFMMAKRFFPHVPKTYEISENGSILIAEYIQPYASFAEMLRDEDKIRKILKDFASVYFIGDAGISSNNFANWGRRPGYDDPVCLDYAYAYEVNSELFTCRQCKGGDPGMLIPDKDYNILQCTKCHKTKSFSDLRGMSRNIQLYTEKDLSREGYKLDQSYVKTVLDPERSNYLSLKNKKIKKKSVVEKETQQSESIKDDSFIFDDNMKEDINMSEVSTSIKSIAATIVDERYRNYGNVVKPKGVVVVEDEVKGEPEQTEIKKDVTIVEAKPATSTVAFSGKIDKTIGQETEEVMAVPEEKQVVEEPNEEPVHEPEVSHEDPKRNDPKYVTMDDFIKFIHPAISKMSNRMAYDIRTLNLFDTLKPYIANKKIMPKAFYDAVQAAIWKTLGPYVGCVEKTNVPNRDNAGTHTEWGLTIDIVEGLSTESYNTLLFIMRMFKNNVIRSVVVEDDVPGNEYIIKYLDEYPNSEVNGIDEEWCELFKSRLKTKLAISDTGVDLILDEFIDRGWIQVEDEDDESEPVDEEDEINYGTTDEGDDESENPYEEIEREISDELGDIINEEEEVINEETNYVSVDLIHDDNFDTVKLSFNDYNGLCSIPFYTNLDEITITEEDKTYSPVDPRNSFWDWLRFIAPDIKFYTKNPDKYLEGNKPIYRNEEDDTESHYVILTKKGDEYLIGAYLLNGIFVIDDDGDAEYIYDDELYWKINKLIRGSLENSPVSFYLKAISDMSTLKTEAYFLGHAEEEEVEDETYEEEQEPENEESGEETTEMTDEQRMQEEAALAAMTSTPQRTATVSPRNDDNIIRGYLVEERKNKTVNRTFYYDADHIEKVEGEKGKTYVDVSDGSPTNVIYKWNGKNYIPTKLKGDFVYDQKEPTVVTEKQTVAEVTEADDVAVVKKETTPTDNSGDEIPVYRRKK